MAEDSEDVEDVTGKHIAKAAKGSTVSREALGSIPYKPIAFFPHKCPNCGASLEEGDWFCEECGFVVSPIATGNHDPEAQVQADPLEGSDASRQQDPVAKSDASAYADPSKQTDPSRHADLSDHVDPSRQTDPLKQADPLRQTDPLAGSGDLSGRDRLAAHDAYAPETIYTGPSPLAVAGGIAAATLVVVLLVKPGVFGLPAVTQMSQTPAAAGSATGSAAGSAAGVDGSAAGEDGERAAEGDGGDVTGGDGTDNASADSGSAGSDTPAADESNAGGPSVTLPDGGAAGQDVTYTFVHETMTWTEAEQYCEAHGGQLAQPTTKEAWRAFRDLCDESDAYVIYLGAQRQADGTFAWLDGSPVDIKVWGAGEPNNVDGVENCLAYLRYTGGGAIYDVPDDPAVFYPDGYIGFVMQTAR